MPFKLKITGPGVNDFEWVWEEGPTELPPVDLPEWPAPPRAPYDEAAPDVIPPPDITREAPPPVRQRITITPSPRDPIEAVLPPARQLEPPVDPVDAAIPTSPFPVPEVPQMMEPQQDLIDQLMPVQEPPLPGPRNQQPVRQLYRGILDAPQNLYDLAANVFESMQVPPVGGQSLRGGRPPSAKPFQPTADYLRAAGSSARKQILDLTGAEEVPPDIFSRTAKTVGESIVPGSNAAKMSAIVGGSNVAVNEARRLAANPAFSGGGSPDWLSGALVSPAGAAEGQFDSPQGETIVETVSGPKAVKTSEVMAVGTIALATIGMIYGPRVYQRIVSSDIPRMRPVREAVPGTVAISRPRDLAITYHDANAGAFNIMRRAGVDPIVAREVENTFRIQTRATANAMADSAINAGRMETPVFTFQSRTPLAQLGPLESQPVRDYLHVMDTLDDLRQRSLHMLNRRIPGTPVVRGMDVAQAGVVRRALEASNPEVVQIAREYWDITRNLRNFEATGEYATVSRSQNAFLKRSRPHEVPLHPRYIGDPRTAQERGSAVEALGKDMRQRLRDRMENEAKGKFVDETRRVMPNTFVPVTREQLADNPHWRKNVVEFKRRGEIERYTTDPLLADVLRMDPYYITSMTGNVFYSAKRALEVTTTGELAPWFAPVSMYRNLGIGRFTAEEGMLPPSVLGTHMAVPRQIAPQMANYISRTLDANSGGWLTNVFGQGNIDALSQRLAHAYQNSLFHQLETVGGGRGSILQQQTSANNRLANAIRDTTGPARQFLEGYRSLLNSVHNAAAFDYARRNQGRVSLPELGMRARNMTGDPRIGGEYYTTLPGATKPSAIRFVDEESRVSHTLGRFNRGLHGPATEFGRTSVSWYNATVQGVRRLGQSYTENPAKFTARTWLYYIAPSASLYMATQSLGNDPNGMSYIDYAMNRRSEYNKIMNFYVPIPGRPAEEGIEFPAFHENTWAKYLTSVAMDHVSGNAVFTEKEDLVRGAVGIADVLWFPSPAVFNIYGASQGYVTSGGAFTGESYKKPVDPFDQLGGLPPTLELYARAIAPGIGDIVGTGAAAFTQTPEGYSEALWNAVRAGGRRVVEKTPVVRNVVGMTPPMTGNNAITEELFKKQKELSQLDRFYKQMTVNEGLLRPKPPSVSGAEAATKILGERPPSEPAGIEQPQPTNPLYKMFMEELHNKLIKDATLTRKGEPTGAIGFQSLWDRYRMATDHLKSIRKVNEGNEVTWKEQMEDKPAQLAFLKKNNIDPDNIRAVRNFYEKTRQDAARVILTQIRAVEAEFSQRLGRPMTLKDLDPYKMGLKGDTSDPTVPQIDLPQ
jgi:hypothetical protein